MTAENNLESVVTNEYREELNKYLKDKDCPTCGCVEIGIDNWGIFEGKRDWFYYCKECDETFF